MNVLRRIARFFMADRETSERLARVDQALDRDYAPLHRAPLPLPLYPYPPVPAGRAIGAGQ